MDFVINKNVPVPKEYQSYAHLSGALPKPIIEELNSKIPTEIDMPLLQIIYENLYHNKIENFLEFHYDSIVYKYDVNDRIYKLNLPLIASKSIPFKHPMHPIYLKGIMPMTFELQTNATLFENRRWPIPESFKQEHEQELEQLRKCGVRYENWCNIVAGIWSLHSAILDIDVQFTSGDGSVNNNDDDDDDDMSL